MSRIRTQCFDAEYSGRFARADVPLREEPDEDEDEEEDDKKEEGDREEGDEDDDQNGGYSV